MVAYFYSLASPSFLLFSLNIGLDGLVACFWPNVGRENAYYFFFGSSASFGEAYFESFYKISDYFSPFFISIISTIGCMILLSFFLLVYSSFFCCILCNVVPSGKPANTVFIYVPFGCPNKFEMDYGFFCSDYLTYLDGIVGNKKLGPLVVFCSGF